MYILHLDLAVDFRGNVRREKFELDPVAAHETVFGAYVVGPDVWVIWKDAFSRKRPDPCDYVTTSFIEERLQNVLIEVKNHYRA